MLCLPVWVIGFCMIACSAHFLLCHAFVHLASVPMFPNVLSSSLCLHHITPSAQTHTTLNKPACCALHNWAGVVVRCVACSCILFIFQTTNTTSITQTTASTTHLTTLLLSLSSAPILPAISQIATGVLSTTEQADLPLLLNQRTLRAKLFQTLSSNQTRYH